jgi:hypothetical protein
MKIINKIFYKNGKIYYPKLIINGFLIIILSGVIINLCIFFIFQKNFIKDDKIFKQISNNHILKNELGSSIFKDPSYSIDKKISNNKAIEIKYVRGNNKHAIIEIWYENAPPDYKFDSLDS